MLKIYGHLLPAAELNYRKGGGQAGLRSTYRLKGCKCPPEEQLAGHSHVTKCSPEEKSCQGQLSMHAGMSQEL